MSDPVIMARLAAIEMRLAALEGGGAPRTNGSSSTSGGAVADDADLDGKYGDARIKYGLKAKYWKEQPDPFIGKTWSRCTPEYLDAAAKYLDGWAFVLRKQGDEKKAGYKELDASRCRGWARRIRGGWKPPPEPESAWGGADAGTNGGGFGDSGGFGGGSSFGSEPSDADDSFNFGANASAEDEEEKPL